MSYFIPQNRLEELLVLSCENLVYRPQFYRKLIDSSIYVLPAPSSVDAESGKLKTPNIRLQMIKLSGQAFLPMFTSLKRIQESVAAPVKYLQIPCKTLFEITQGTDLFLNPYSEYGKQVLPEEAKGLVDGSYFFQLAEEKFNDIFLSQPLEAPAQLIDSLTKIFQEMPEVKSAYLAQCLNHDRDNLPGLLIAIEASGDWEKLAAMAAHACAGLSQDFDFVDFYPLKQGHPQALEEYFYQKVKPFFRRKFIQRLFGS